MNVSLVSKITDRCCLKLLRQPFEPAIGVFDARQFRETWQRQRRMVMASFDPAHVKRYFPALQTVAQRLIGRWKAAARASTWRSPWHRSGYG